MPQRTVRNLLYAFLLLLAPVAWLAMKYDPYQIDGDAVNFMDLADLVHAHNWHAIVNGYWHPLYPAALALGQILFHPSRSNELGAYYAINFLIFLAEVVAILAFVNALVRLRSRSNSPTAILQSGEPLLTANAMRFLALGLLLVATQRELSLGKVRSDSLLQALMLAAFAALMCTLSAETYAATLLCAPLAGVFFGLAYLTKSFALTVGLLSIVVMAVFGVCWQRRTWKWAVAVAALAFAPFALISVPYVAALSHKYGHLDFGDSGALNFAWYAGNTEKMHLEPWMTSEFGTADVHLAHPEVQLMQTPGLYSYKAVTLGTYPDWFDASYFNQGIKPHIRFGPLLKRDARNVVLVLRYLLNHPEGPVLLLLLLLAGGRFRARTWRTTAFWLPMVVIGLAMWCIYGLVNIEERYVTLAYFAVALPIFAALREPELARNENEAWPRRVACGMVIVFAFLALGESLRIALDERRTQPAGTPAWHDAEIFGAADALAKSGIHAGDEVACMGTTACLHDYYWARLAGVRIPTEIYAPDGAHLLEEWHSLSNRAEVLNTLREQGAKALVTVFVPEEATDLRPQDDGWVRLGATNFYILPLTFSPPATPPAAPVPWVTHAQGNQ